MRRNKATVQKKNHMLNFVVKLAAIASIIGCLVSIISTQSTIAEKERELQQIQSKTSEIEIENVEYERILDSDDLNAYMEKIAIENMNYAYPNERRFYDKSRN